MIVAVTGLETLYLNNQKRIDRVEDVLLEAMGKAKNKGFIFATTNRTGIDKFTRQYDHVILVADDDFLENCEIGIVVKSHQPHPRLDKLIARLSKVFLIDLLDESHGWIKNDKVQ